MTQKGGGDVSFESLGSTQQKSISRKKQRIDSRDVTVEQEAGQVAREGTTNFNTSPVLLLLLVEVRYYCPRRVR